VKASPPSALLDTRVIYCGDCLEQLRKLPPACVGLIYIDPPFNSNRNYEVFWGETKEKRAFEDRHASTQAYIDYMRPRCVELARVLKKTGSFYYHCDWHASHYVKVMLDQIFGENNFINEIIWKRQSAHNDAKQGSKHLGRVHDSIFLYTGGGRRLLRLWHSAGCGAEPRSSVGRYRRFAHCLSRDGEASAGRLFDERKRAVVEGASRRCFRRARSAQPYAEEMLRGIKTVEYRGRRTTNGTSPT
jgi:hypothetical protein